MKEEERKLPIEPVPESEPHKKRTKEEEFFIQEEQKMLKKLKEKAKTSGCEKKK